jgi:hypothetical protein
MLGRLSSQKTAVPAPDLNLNGCIAAQRRQGQKLRGICHWYFTREKLFHSKISSQYSMPIRSFQWP